MPNAASTAAILAELASRRSTNPLDQILAGLNTGVDSFINTRSKTAMMVLQREIARRQAEIAQQNANTNAQAVGYQGRRLDRDDQRANAESADLAALQRPVAPVPIPGQSSALNGLLNTPTMMMPGQAPIMNTRVGYDAAQARRREGRDWKKYTDEAASKKTENDRRFGLLREQFDLQRDKFDQDTMMEIIGLTEKMAAGRMTAQEFDAKMDNLKARTADLKAGTKAKNEMLPLEKDALTALAEQRRASATQPGSSDDKEARAYALKYVDMLIKADVDGTITAENVPGLIQEEIKKFKAQGQQDYLDNILGQMTPEQIEALLKGG